MTSSSETVVTLRPIVDTVSHSVELPESDATPRKESRDPVEIKRLRRARAMIASSVTIVTIALVAGVASLFGGSKPVERSLVYYTVQPRDLRIAVTERGTLESQQKVEVKCEVDDIRGDGIYGTPILTIVENGKSVKKGDLLVELDTSSHLERLDEQILDAERARARYIKLSIHYENRLTRNETLRANAELKVEMTKLELQQYEDEQGGKFQIELQGVELFIQQYAARRQIDDRNLVGTEYLHELGYKSKGDLAHARLQALRTESALNREMAKRRKLVDYSYTRSKLKLHGAVQSAERRLVQVVRDNAADLAQAEAWKNSAELSLKKENERLARYREQLERCKIYAPQSGMVAYHVEANRWGQSSTIAEGVAVRDRQSILSIPSLSRMQVKTSVHESVVDRVKIGMPATVRLDAFPDLQFEATVDSVAVLPDPGGWLSSDTKVYKTVVKIDEDIEGDMLKPGMTAVAEIQIDHLSDVLCVPVQALVQRGEETWCYLSRDGQVHKSLVNVGVTNDKFVEIRSGIEAGDQVVLNPTAILLDGEQEPLASEQENGAEPH